MKDETGGVAIDGLVGLKPKMYSFLVDNSKHEEVKGANRNAVATISHNKHKDVLLNNKCIRHSMNRIQNKMSQKCPKTNIRKYLKKFSTQRLDRV